VVAINEKGMNGKAYNVTVQFPDGTTKKTNVGNLYTVDTKDEDNIKSKIIAFFKANPNPDDKKIHAFAEEQQINSHELETNIYSLLSERLKNKDSKITDAIELKKSDAPDDQFDAEQLAMGIKVEQEHTNDLEIAKAIAKAHLSEKNSSKYYSYLVLLEDLMKNNVSLESIQGLLK
jgi:hypothetical protein